jgi:hypothetical protein
MGMGFGQLFKGHKGAQQKVDGPFVDETSADVLTFENPTTELTAKIPPTK